MPRTNRKHFLLTKSEGIITATTPKNWARDHKTAFPKYDFSNSDNTPIVDVIEDYLIKKHGFKRIENEEVVILYNVEQA